MNVSVNWLKQYVDLEGISPEELANALTSSGLEVEGLEKLAYGTNLVIGEVKTCVDHPDSDHLHVCEVFDGKETRQIVCGAPNAPMAVGKKVIVALPGCELPGGTISHSKIRGVESDGMICSLAELGVDKKSLTEEQLAGIEILKDDAEVGNPNVLEYLGYDDTILDVSLTPNRADCIAMWSLAKQTGAVLNRKVTLPEEYHAEKELPATIKVTLETEKCPWFIAKVIHHVKLGPSPEWMQKVLAANGVKSINNIVDISNYVMLETGQPNHFYDLRRIQGPEIEVKDGFHEKYEALDEIVYDIEPEDIMITNQGRMIGIGGIMGGEDSKIEEDTCSLVIEAACFDHVQIRNSALRLNLQTDAATRFIKMIEPQAGLKAVWRSVDLLTKYADASDIEETVIAGNIPLEERTISLTLDKVNAVLGTNFTMDEIVEPLNRLDFRPEVDGNVVTVHVPSYRYNDMSIAEDVIEDIIQIKGYDNIEGTLPEMPQTIGTLEPLNQMGRKIKRYLKGNGLHEIFTYSLVGQRELDDGVISSGEPVVIMNPMSDERKYFRTSLTSSLFEAIQYNLAHSAKNFSLFEIATVYANDGKMETHLSLGGTGSLVESEWNKRELPMDYYWMKGLLYGLLEELGYSASRIKVEAQTDYPEMFHPYQSVKVLIDKDCIGYFGMIHPKKQKEYDLDRTCFGEINLSKLMEHKSSKLKYTSIPKYPSTFYDLSMLVDQETPVGDIEAICKKNGTKVLHEFKVFDVYQGKGVPEGKKSIAVRLTFLDPEKTLTDEEIQPIVSKVREALETNLKAEIRDS